MKDKICIFAGTTEGRRLSRLLADRAEVTACVATGYGGISLEDIEGITVRAGRMDADEMAAFLCDGGFSRVIDATHPYADKATGNIAAAAKKAGIPLLRVLREEDARVAGAVYVNSIAEARDYLSDHGGNILITTGSKDLADYSGLDMSRVWVRVLPLASSLEACERAGIAVSHIIAAQGPFSYESNLALIKDINAKFIVTKDSGNSGGFSEKLSAALDAGAVPVIIGRPRETGGVTVDEAIKELIPPHLLPPREIIIIGAGAGNRDLMTAAAVEALESCDAVFGAPSVVDPLNIKKPFYPEYRPDGIRLILDEHPSIRRAAIILRGDTGFFSGAKKLTDSFDGENIEVIPGISSVSLFAARLGTSYDDAACISLHGRSGNPVRTVDEHKKTFILCGGVNTPDSICRALADCGMGDLSAAVGERLSYPDEKISRGRAGEFADMSFDSLSVLYIENPTAKKAAPVGIPDSEFIRGAVPMTKAEIRAVTMSKLAITSRSDVWDIGAGTGSVSVECALSASEGTVFAVEKDPEAISLIRENKRRFHADNITVIEGEAPEVLAGLPAPTHLFIGGSGGRAAEIISTALMKNPSVRIVADAVTLESMTEAYGWRERFGFALFEVVEVNVSYSREVGRYHMMTARNPVMIFTMQGARDDA